MRTICGSWIWAIVLPAAMLIFAAGGAFGGYELSPSMPEAPPPNPRAMNCAFGIVGMDHYVQCFWIGCAIVACTIGGAAARAICGLGAVGAGASCLILCQAVQAQPNRHDEVDGC